MAASAVPDEEKTADLPRLIRMVTEAQSLTAEARTESLIDDDYYHCHQWTTTERNELKARGQPDITINRTRAAVNGILGVTVQGKSEPRAFPRTPKDEDSADVATDVLRFIADKNRFANLKRDAFRDMLVPGSMGVLVGADADKQITLEPIRWEELLYDPKARRPDFADARYMGIAKWMYADDAATMFPGKKGDIESAVNDGALIGDMSFQDRPDSAGSRSWVDRRQRRLLMIELYYRESGWKRCVFHAGGVLQYGDSPYLDDKRRPCNPIEAQSAYVDRHNNRYGAVRDMRGPQDEINKRRSKLLHLVNTSQIQAVDPSAVEVDANAARSEAARPDGVIPFGWQKVATTDVATGQAQLLAEAKGELERLGPNPAVLGRQGSDSSGRAVLARQQAGMVELAVLFGGLEDWELRVYRQMWSRAKQFWTEPMFIRVTDDEDAPKFIALNEPQYGQAQVVADPETGMATIHRPVLGYQNSMAEMDVDITLDSVPDTANIQQEQLQDLMQLVSSNPTYATQIPFEIMLELTTLPRKRQLIDRLKKNGQQDPAAQQAQLAQQQLIQAGEAAKVEETRTKAQLNQTNALLNRAKTAQITSDTQMTQLRAPFEVARETAEHHANLDNLHTQTVETALTGAHQRSLPQAPQPAAGASGA